MDWNPDWENPEQNEFQTLTISCSYHSSGNKVCIPLQSYTLSTANQNLPQEGIQIAPPVITIINNIC